ncbi:hypothetical protein MMC26_004721 [Xylographa opegraphella]|nr:hypothetical protein [Xylographa opegraphella]
MALIEASISSVDTELFHQLDTYQWASDEEFQSGLRAILGPDPKPEQAEQLTLRARCFYYSRKHNLAVDFDAYREWHARLGSSTQMKLEDAVNQSSEKFEDRAAEPPAPYPLSFSHIVDLITSGQPVPGVKDIPNTVLDGQASQATRPQRRKPWETARSNVAAN